MSKSVILRDGQEIDRCLGCQRDWTIVKHSSGGLCRGCARMKQHKEAKSLTQWSEKFAHCQNSLCPNTKDGTTSQPHNANGLCRSCYSKKQRHDNHLHSLQVEAVRRETKRNALKENENN